MVRRLAYADPPYPGQAHRYAGGREVNHPLLIEYLRTFDGWALSTSAAALLEVWQLAPEARCAAWARTYAANGWSRVRWSWEPVLFVTDRRALAPGERSTVWDALVAAPGGIGGHGEGFTGAKPAAFTAWVLELLDWHEGDHLEDLFPGSGAVTAAARCRQPELALT